MITEERLTEIEARWVDEPTARLDENDDLHFVGKDIRELIAALRSERQARQAAEQNSNDLEALFDLQHKRTVVADELWREAHPGNDLVMPDLGKLIEWLLERGDNEKARADALLAAGAGLAEILRDLKADWRIRLFGDGYDYEFIDIQVLATESDAALAAWEQAQPEKEKG